MENDVALGQRVVRKGERDREQDELDTLKHVKEPSINTMRGEGGGAENEQYEEKQARMWPRTGYDAR